ncbi:MAG: DUF1854 domain-containing protein [Fimbriimonadaceae bacterium]|nr:DUF1854 domain-containing protein [Fimbriimonadaceae bacterium]
MITPTSDNIKLFHEPKDVLRMTVGDQYSVVQIEPRWAAPLSHPGQLLGLMNSKGEEVLLVPAVDSLSQENQEVIQRELDRRYLTSTVHKIVSAKVEFGATYWTVITERGQRDFVVQSLQENAQWLGERQLVFVDIDHNRFEVPDIDKLDPQSRKFIDSIL